MEMGQVSNYFFGPVARVGTKQRVELDQNWQLSPLRDNQRFPGHTIAPRQVTRKINADSGLASLLFHAPPPPAAGTGTRGAELASSLVPYYEMSTDLVQTNPSC